MLVFSRVGLVYLEIPKTGSTAFNAAFRHHADTVITAPAVLRHMDWRRYNRTFRPALEKAYGQPVRTMAIIREPIDWLGSWYRYRCRPDAPDRERSAIGCSFAEFAEAYLAIDRPPMTDDIRDQTRFLSDQEGRLAIDILFRYAEWSDAVAFLSREVGKPGPIERRNVSPSRDMSLPDSLRRRLELRFGEDIALYTAVGAGAYSPRPR